jgi:hypothetical protein
MPKKCTRRDNRGHPWKTNSKIFHREKRNDGARRVELCQVRRKHTEKRKGKKKKEKKRKRKKKA